MAAITTHWQAIGPGTKPRYTICRCVCGVEREVRRDHLTSGASASCGCIQPPHNLRHGHNGSPTHMTWTAMRSRCSDANRTNYAYYGGRGIRVCERWNVFENFLADMGERPPGTTLDRINVDGNYEPGNCRWATKTEQRANRRDSHGTHA